MQLSVQHNLSQEELRKAITGMAIGSGIEQEVLDTLLKAKACDDTPKEPRTRAMRELYAAMQEQFRQSGQDVVEYISEIAAVPLHKAIGPAAFQMSSEQVKQIMSAIEDRYGFIAAQLQSVEYQPPADLLYRWQQMGLVSHTVTPETFMGTVATDMHFVRNAFLMGRFIEAVESGKSFAEVMQLAAHSPLLKPDLHAIQIAEQQTAMYLQDNAKDLATKAGQLAIQKRNDHIRQMAIDFHDRKLKRTVLDREEKEALGEDIPDRYVENWQQFKSELHQTMTDKSRDWDRVAYTELVTAQETGKAYKILEDHGSDTLVYKRTLPTACPQCVHAYCEEDGVTPKVFKLSTLLANGDNFSRKPHPTRAGKVVEGGRPDGAETMKPVSGTMHPFCACRLYKLTKYEHWYKDATTQKD